MPRVCPAAHGTNPPWQWVSGVQARLPQVWGELEQWGDHNFKKSYFFSQVTYCTILFFFKVYNDRSLQVHFQRHLDSNECVLGNELPYVCETCGKGNLLVCLNSFSCFMLFMFFFSDKKYTRLVQSHKLHTSRGEQGMQGVFQSYPFVPPLIPTLSYLSHFWFQSILSVPLLIWLSLIDISLISGRGGP